MATHYQGYNIVVYEERPITWRCLVYKGIHLVTDSSTWLVSAALTKEGALIQAKEWIEHTIREG